MESKYLHRHLQSIYKPKQNVNIIDEQQTPIVQALTACAINHESSIRQQFKR